tara:strand:- start:13473 stop:13799 length:327 start_codon:yes stop_codon:yes gene_type:complete
VELSPETDYYADAVSLDERVRAVEEVCRLYVPSRPLRILVNVRELEMRLSFYDQQTFGDFLASHPELSDARVQVLHNQNHNPNIVIEMSAFNGGYTLAQFNDTNDAED